MTFDQTRSHLHHCTDSFPAMTNTRDNSFMKKEKEKKSTVSNMTLKRKRDSWPLQLLQILPKNSEQGIPACHGFFIRLYTHIPSIHMFRADLWSPLITSFPMQSWDYIPMKTSKRKYLDLMGYTCGLFPKFARLFVVVLCCLFQEAVCLRSWKQRK